jgi:hypothetical protein
MVTVMGAFARRGVRAEIHRPHNVRGASDLVTLAAAVIRPGVTVCDGPGRAAGRPGSTTT